MRDYLLDSLNGQARNENSLIYIDTVLYKNVVEGRLTEGEAEHIIDWLNSGKGPKRVKKLSLEDAKRLAKDWTDRMIKKAGNIIETEQDTEVIKQYKSGFKLVKLVGENSYKREGKLMGHCVGSYFDRDKSVEIYSIRDLQNNPHCTIELRREDSQINQVKGKGNGPIHPKYIEVVLKSLKKLGVEVRESEYQYLGYKKISDELKLFIRQNFTGDKYLTIGNKELFYINSNLKPIK